MTDRSRPPVIFITTDTQGQNMVGAYGKNPAARTPNIDRLAEEGVLFERSYCAAPVCTPARSTWYTGLPPNRNGAVANDIAPARHLPMLGDILSAAGYRPVHLGKWHLDAGGYTGRGTAAGGFDSDIWFDQINFLEEVGRDGINRFGGWNKGLEDIEFCYAHRVADRAIEVMHAHQGDSPLFLAVDFDEPHGPYICPPPFRGRNRQEELPVPDTFTSRGDGKPRIQQEMAEWLAGKRPSSDTYPRYYHKYYDCNEYVDHEIGRVVEAARSIFGESAVIIYTSDHGDHLGHFGLQPKGPTMYEATTAVPLVVSAPEFQPRSGVRTRVLAGSADIWATILDCAEVDRQARGLTDPGYWGRSLLPAVRGATQVGGTEEHGGQEGRAGTVRPDGSWPPSSREAVFVEFNRFGKGHDAMGEFFPIRCVVSDRWKLAINLFDTDELYDLNADPLETTNRIEDPGCADERNRLHDLLLDHLWATRDTYRCRQWGERPWRPDYRYEFAGLQTTGIRDRWESGSFFE